MDYQEILTRANLHDNDIVCIYHYGSRVYGNLHKGSDYDFIIITKNKQGEQFSDNKINISFQTISEFEEKLKTHEISQLECYFLPEHLILKQDKKFSFNLDLSKLRQSLSTKSSNSFVKAKKKLTVEKDYDVMVGKKSLFHSFRIINFGIQIAKHGKIIDYSICNNMFYEILYNFDNDWQKLFDSYKQPYNNLMTEFRLLAPK